VPAAILEVLRADPRFVRGHTQTYIRTLMYIDAYTHTHTHTRTRACRSVYRSDKCQDKPYMFYFDVFDVKCQFKVH